MDRDILIFDACTIALRECRQHDILTYEHFFLKAKKYGKSINITDEEIIKMVHMPLEVLLKIPEKKVARYQHRSFDKLIGTIRYKDLCSNDIVLTLEGNRGIWSIPERTFYEEWMKI